ncbi:rCG59649, isoform CRA_b [Rattus norvegicus]|uniref:RCG59649, isoform CRA_b n=1 Tax=Rattus norvegicus TaxID=10116 RepID=A6HRY5_RAT|nr:rCG59649, isoform CRA_b [Rattus norvegicus]
MGQCLYQPTVGTASSCLVRAWVAFLYHQGYLCSLSSILPQPRLFLSLSLSLSPLTPRHIRSSLLTERNNNTCPKGSEPSSPSSGNLPTGRKDTPPQDPHLYETAASY